MKKTKEILKQFAYFLAICMWVVGTIGGVGYSCYSHAYFIAVCVLVTGILAFPAVKSLVKKQGEYNVNATSSEETEKEATSNSEETKN